MKEPEVSDATWLPLDFERLWSSRREYNGAESGFHLYDAS
jgi:hypothetical protein